MFLQTSTSGLAFLVDRGKVGKERKIKKLKKEKEKKRMKNNEGTWVIEVKKWIMIKNEELRKNV